MSTKNRRKQIEQVEATTILNSVKDIKVGDVISQVNNLQVTVQKTLADLCSTVTNKVQQVEEVDTAIVLKNQRLKELFLVEAEAISLEEFRAKKEEEMSAWEQQVAERQSRLKEEQAELEKIRKREQENYLYDMTQKKKKLESELAEEFEKTKKIEQDRKEQFEKDLKVRNEVLAGKETYLKDLELKVSGFDKIVNDTVIKAQKELTETLKKNHEHQIALLEKDSISAKALSELKINSLNEQINNLLGQVEDLQSQLISARADAKEVANEALKSASSRQLAETLQKVVTDQQMNGKTK